MKVVTAVEQFYNPQAIKCFLGGGITNCPDWQSEVIDNFNAYNDKFPDELNDLVIFNPRRKNFPIGDPGAAKEQIEWEFNWLQKMDIFSMFFAGGESDQPICMYELGRNLYRMYKRFGNDFHRRIVISCDSNYKRANDVKIQTALALSSSSIDDDMNKNFVYREPKQKIISDADPFKHMIQIIKAYNFVKSLRDEGNHYVRNQRSYHSRIIQKHN